MLDLGWVSFNSGLYLIGALSALIPLLIHLSRSRRTKKMRFSTTRFFTEQFLRSYRMSRVREILLLLCRMALFALLAMALAQPLLKWNAPSLSVSREARTVMLVVDNSASMNYTENEVSQLDRARTAARTVVEGLRSSDRVGIVLAGRLATGPEVLLEPTTDRNDAVHALDKISIVKQEKGKPDIVRALGTDLGGALARAEDLVKSANTPGREIYVFSDLQESGWGSAEKEKSATESSDISYVFVQARPQQVANVSVTAVQYGAARPLVGVPFLFRPYLVIQGDLGTSTIRVSLWVYEKDKEGQWLYADKDSKQRKARKVAEQEVLRQPSGRWTMPRLYHAFTAPGWQAGYVEVERVAPPGPASRAGGPATPPALQVDSRRYFALEVLETVKVLAVNGAPSQVRVQDELFFLRLALTASLEDQKSPLELDEVAPANLAETLADPDKFRAGCPLIVLANVESLPEAAVEKLEEFTARGGSLLFFLGDRVDAVQYNDSLSKPTRHLGGLLPGRLLKVEGNPKEDKAVSTIGAVAYDHPALSAFQDARFAALGGVQFKALFRVEADPGQVLMKSNSDAPLLCEKEYGKGRVMLFTSTCNRNWTNFPLRPAFLPFTHRLVAYLAQQPGSQQAFYLTGEMIPLLSPGADGVPLLVRKPGGEVESATGTDPDTGSLTYSAADQPGVYAVVTPEQKEVGLFAVNLESYESDLSYLDEVWTEELKNPSDAERTAAVEKGLKQQLKRPLVSYVANPAGVSDVTGGRQGFRLWDWLLVVVLVIGLFEPWLANQISARLFARQVPAPALTRAPSALETRPLPESKASATPAEAPTR